MSRIIVLSSGDHLLCLLPSGCLFFAFFFYGFGAGGGEGSGVFVGLVGVGGGGGDEMGACVSRPEACVGRRRRPSGAGPARKRRRLIGRRRRRVPSGKVAESAERAGAAVGSDRLSLNNTIFPRRELFCSAFLLFLTLLCSGSVFLVLIFEEDQKELKKSCAFSACL